MNQQDPSPKKNMNNDILDSEVSSQTAEEIFKVKKLARWVLGFGLGGFILFASFVPMDEGVPTLGQVTLDTKRKVVQHQQGGLVSEVLVREGQEVTSGQTLLRLNQSAFRAAYESSRQQYLSLRITEARLVSELGDDSQIYFDKDLVDLSRKDSRLYRQMQMQNQLLQTRRKSLNYSTQALKESATGQQSAFQSSKEVEGLRKSQLASLESEISGVKDLVKEGFAPLSKQLEMERQIAEIRAGIIESGSSSFRARQSVLEIDQRIANIRADFKKDAEQQLNQIKPELQAVSERYFSAEQDLERTDIKAPVAGQVVGLSVQTTGSVIQPGQKIMDIVPRDELLIVETKIATNLIDRIKPGNQVDVRFSGFADAPQLVIPAVLTTLSSDVLTDQGANASPYYLARVSILPEGIKELGKRKMQPGMQVEVIIKTGSRTLLQYLISPLTKRIAASLKEQ